MFALRAARVESNPMDSTSTAPVPERPDLSALAAMAAALGAAHHVEDVLAIAVEEVRRLYGAASVSVSRWERERGWLRTLINVGEAGEREQRPPEHDVYRISDYPHLVALLEAGKANFVAIDDPSSDDAARALLRRSAKRSAMSVPIVVDEATWGELYATSPADGRRLDAADEPVVRLIAEQLGLAIARAELLERLTDLAYRDPLTGLENRRALEDRLEAALSASRRGDRPVSLILCDLDHLKQINDGQGHDAGDAALRRVAAVLTVQASAMPGTLVCRLGGDEFCLLLEGCELEAAHALAEQALEALSEGLHPLGLSCGVASTRLLVDRPTDLLRAADGALYAAKRTGRGQICIADTEPAAAWRASAASRREQRDMGKANSYDLAELLAEALSALDGPLSRVSVVDRLQALATILGGALNASAVSVSQCRPGARAVTTAFTLDRRSGHSSGAVVALQDSYPLDDFPTTARLLSALSSSIIEADDPAADPAERALLVDWGMHAVLLATARGRGGGWLLEIYADVGTHNLYAAQGVVRVLVTQAVHGAREIGEALAA